MENEIHIWEERGAFHWTAFGRKGKCATINEAVSEVERLQGELNG